MAEPGRAHATDTFPPASAVIVLNFLLERCLGESGHGG